MKAYLRAWAIGLVVIAAYCAYQAEMDLRQSRVEHCAVVRCS